MVSSKEKARLITSAALEKKAEDVLLLDIKGISDIADYFIIVSANSSKQIEAIADNIEAALKGRGFAGCRRQGRSESMWVVLDLFDCVVHIFYSKIRRFYNLERLWRDAKIVKLGAEKPKAGKKSRTQKVKHKKQAMS